VVSARPQYVGSRDTGIVSIALAASTMTYSVLCTPYSLVDVQFTSQTVFDQLPTSRLVLVLVLVLGRDQQSRCRTLQNEIRRSGILFRWSGCLELSSRWTT